MVCMYLQVPEKIKMLEINLSFLQSYMEETKKGHDESFEDISSEVEHLKAALAALKAEVQAGTADMASRFKTLEDKWSVMEAEHKVTAEKMEEQQGLLDQLKVSGTWGAAGVGAVGRGWGGWLAVFMAVVGVFVAVWWLFGSASTNGKGLEGLRGKAWSALYALAGHLRLVKQLEAVLSLLGYRFVPVLILNTTRVHASTLCVSKCPICMCIQAHTASAQKRRASGACPKTFAVPFPRSDSSCVWDGYKRAPSVEVAPGPRTQ
jgi:hypothetical protein